jgi:hypothetical protein
MVVGHLDPQAVRREAGGKAPAACGRIRRTCRVQAPVDREHGLRPLEAHEAHDDLSPGKRHFDRPGDDRHRPELERCGHGPVPCGTDLERDADELVTLALPRSRVVRCDVVDHLTLDRADRDEGVAGVEEGSETFSCRLLGGRCDAEPLGTALGLCIWCLASVRAGRCSQIAAHCRTQELARLSAELIEVRSSWKSGHGVSLAARVCIRAR